MEACRTDHVCSAHHPASKWRIAPRASSPHLRFITRKRSRSSRNNNRGEFFRIIADQFFDMVIERYDSYRSIARNGNPVSPGCFCPVDVSRAEFKANPVIRIILENDGNFSHCFDKSTHILSYLILCECQALGRDEKQIGSTVFHRCKAYTEKTFGIGVEDIGKLGHFHPHIEMNESVRA